MTAKVATAVATRKSEPVVRFGGSTTGYVWMADLVAAAKGLWPKKTNAELAVRTGFSDRACEAWLSMRTNMSADAVVALLRSDDGFVFLSALVGPAKPKWWRGFKKRVRKAQLSDQLRELQLQLNLVDEDEE